MSKDDIRQLTNILASHMHQKDFGYRKTILVLVRIALVLYKLMQGALLLHVNKTFAIGKSTMFCIIKDFIFAINGKLRSKINWPRGVRLIQTICDFKECSSLPKIVGAIMERTLL